MPIPKSLHTVTVVRDIAYYLRNNVPWGKRASATELTLKAFEILGYPQLASDPHDLRSKCEAAVLKDMDKERQRG